MKILSTRNLERDEFPPLLREIQDPPKKLSVIGTIPPENYTYLCVVGSRKNTPYGKLACEKLIAGLSGYPICIVSGLALGIDTIAHKAALAAKLPTIAVPGSGLDQDVLYPASNRNLAQEILRNGGALISEFENNFKATPWSFPQRNRIMAGLSHAVLVIEAEEKSGTLITAKLAAEYNRELLVVPGSIFSPTSAGPHLFMKIGAAPVTSSTDILEALHLKTEEIKPKQIDLEIFSEHEQILIKILQEQPLPRGELIEKSCLRPQDANMALSLLELNGIISESSGLLRL